MFYENGPTIEPWCTPKTTEFDVIVEGLYANLGGENFVNK